MRVALRLLAEVKPKFLEPGAPTGITGLLTHSSPRSTLIYVYSQTLDRLKQIPEHSVYRQSTEALTKHRLKIINDIKPAGWDEWAQRAEEKIKQHPDAFTSGRKDIAMYERDGRKFVETRIEPPMEDVEWDGEEIQQPTLEGTRSEEEGAINARLASIVSPAEEEKVEWEQEPPLEVEQINEAEQKLEAGLIEEVIQVAEGELKLVDTMLESKPWEELEEKPLLGQWEYFTRSSHMPPAQEPAK